MIHLLKAELGKWMDSVEELKVHCSFNLVSATCHRKLELMIITPLAGDVTDKVLLPVKVYVLSAALEIVHYTFVMVNNLATMSLGILTISLSPYSLSPESLIITNDPGWSPFDLKAPGV